MTKSVFSSVPEGEFFSSDQIEGESVHPFFNLDYAPIRKGTLCGTIYFAGKTWKFVTDQSGRSYGELYALKRSLFDRLFGRPGTPVYVGWVNLEAGTVTLDVCFEVNYRYDNEAVEGESAG